MATHCRIRLTFLALLYDMSCHASYHNRPWEKEEHGKEQGPCHQRGTLDCILVPCFVSGQSINYCMHLWTEQQLGVCAFLYNY